MGYKIKRSNYAEIYGPTTGDKVRLGDTSLRLEVEKDLTVYGDECKFGGGKVLREGMGQAAGVGQEDALDCVITNALIVDHTGIYKADVGIKNGRIAGIGKAGNPDVQPGVDIVIDHIAMIDITRPEEEGFTPLLNLHHHPNVYIRTSLHNPSHQKAPFYDIWPYLELLYNTFGPQRLIYANLYELLIMKDLIPFFTPKDKEWILGGTAEKIYFKNRD